MNLSIVYLTNRWEPRFQWFIDSLSKQWTPTDQIEIIVVDFFASEPGRAESLRSLTSLPLRVVEPLPNVFSGPHRLPKDNWFSAANSRNTGLAYARHPWIAYIDDLTFVCPSWMQSVREAITGNYIALGAYKKLRKMVVEKGELKSFEENPGGVDTRIRQVQDQPQPVECDGGWLYGCSLAGPVEYFLNVGGWPSDLCDGMGHEDCCMGKVLRNAGYTLKYDVRMMTYESDEDHFVGEGFKKADKGPAGTEGDKSHRAIRFAERTKYFAQVRNIREIRRIVQLGALIPTDVIGPTFDWFDAQPISEFKY